MSKGSKSTTRVYRMENAESEGPYSKGYKGKRDSVRRPLPQNDGFGEEGRGGKFAFGSPEQASAWFNQREQLGLHKKGFNINAYDVTDPSKVKHGGKQVVVENDYKYHFPHDPKAGWEHMQKLPTPKITIED